MVVSREADRRKSAVWAGLDALGRSRPHLLLQGETATTYLARWQNSTVPAHVLVGRLRRALPDSTILRLRSWPGRADFSASARKGRLETRHNVEIEFALGTEPGVPEDGKPSAEG